jgi:hypothetical protein
MGHKHLKLHSTITYKCIHAGKKKKNNVKWFYSFSFQAKIMCSNACKCFGCKNFEESPERRTLMHLADAAEVRVQQQTAAKTKLSSQISGIPSKPPASTPSGERFENHLTLFFFFLPAWLIRF